MMRILFSVDLKKIVAIDLASIWNHLYVSVQNLPIGKTAISPCSEFQNCEMTVDVDGDEQKEWTLHSDM
jgi:hypothetical protein